MSQFKPHWRAVWVGIVLTMLAVAAIVAAPALLDGNLRWVVPLAVLVIWIVAVFPQFVSWWFTRYVVTNERLIVRRGVFTRKGTEIPLEVLQNVSFSQNLLERLFRSGDLVMESAGSMGQSRFTDIPRVEEVQSLIYRMREDRTVALETGRQVGPVEQLEKLAQLHADGVVSDEEFEAKRQKLLDEI
jgi:uncharacterized membrane protein YdbT with pleckstrin-like domain